MKSFSDFKTIRKEVKDQNVRDQYYREEIYKVGEWVLTEKDNVGKIIRRGPNYVICLTAEDTKFRTWVKDIKEVFEIGTDAYRQYVMSLTPGQKVQKPKGTEKVNQVIPTDPKKDKMDNHESLVQAAVQALNEYSPVPPRKRDPVGSEGTANKNPKGTGGAKGIGGGDAPGMKMAEPKGTKGKPSIKKPKHACATKVEHPEWGEGNCLKEQHTLDEDGTVTHYDVMFNHGLEQNVSVNELNITLSEYHEHAINDDKNKEVLDEGGLDPVNKKAVKKKFANRKDKDIDNDGDVDGSDKFLHKRRKAISKKMATKEHHEKDIDGKVIPHGQTDEDKDKTLGTGSGADGTPSSVEEGKKKGLWDNIHAKRKRGEPKAKKGDKDYPKTLNVEGSMKQARKNVGASSCWKGYKAKGTKMKGGKSVPNCVKEFAEWRKEVTEKKQ
tara:strand:- start:119 stop:1435 length:1317 start_codon:yes stop_codon:yes gene_type:complete